MSATATAPSIVIEDDLTADEAENRATDYDLEADGAVEREEDEAAQTARNAADAYRKKAAELREEAGEATGDGDPAAQAAAAVQRDAEQDDLLPAELIVAGLEQLGKFNAGGKSPTSATLKFTGGSVKLHEGTAFKKGQRIRGTFEAVVNFVGQQDTEDPETRQVTSAQQQHKARFVDLTVEGM